MSDVVKIQNVSNRPFYFPIKPQGKTTGAWKIIDLPEGAIGVFDKEEFEENLKNHPFFKAYRDKGELRVLTPGFDVDEKGAFENKYVAFKNFALNFLASFDSNNPQWASAVDEKGLPTDDVVRMNLSSLDPQTIKLFKDRFNTEWKDGLYTKKIVLPNAANREAVDVKPQGQKVDVTIVNVDPKPVVEKEPEVETFVAKDAQEVKQPAEKEASGLESMSTDDLLALAAAQGLEFERKPSRKALIKALEEAK